MCVCVFFFYCLKRKKKKRKKMPKRQMDFTSHICKPNTDVVQIVEQFRADTNKILAYFLSFITRDVMNVSMSSALVVLRS